MRLDFNKSFKNVIQETREKWLCKGNFNHLWTSLTDKRLCEEKKSNEIVSQIK